MGKHRIKNQKCLAQVSWHHVIALDLGQVSVFSELSSLSCKTATVAKASPVLQMLWNVVLIEREKQCKCPQEPRPLKTLSHRNPAPVPLHTRAILEEAW